MNGVNYFAYISFLILCQKNPNTLLLHRRSFDYVAYISFDKRYVELNLIFSTYERVNTRDQ